MIETQAGDTANQRAFDDVGRIEPSAETDFENAGIRSLSRESQDCDCGRDLEEAGLDSVADVQCFGEKRRELVVIDQCACDAYALIEAHEVRAGESMIYHLPFRDWLELNKSPSESIAGTDNDPEAGNGDRS